MRQRNPHIIWEQPRFEAHKDHIVAVIELSPNQTIGIRFHSPEHLLEFMNRMMEKAAEVWPDNPWIKEWLE